MLNLKIWRQRYEKILYLLICFIICVNLFISVNAIQIDEEASENRFESLINSLDRENNNEVLIWTDDIDYNAVEEATYLKTGLRKEDLTDDTDISTVQNYIKTKRKISKSAYKNLNTWFYEKNIKSAGCSVVFQSNYSPLFILSGTKDQLKKVLANESVKNATLNVEFKVEQYSDVSNKNLGIEYLRDTPSIDGDG